MESTKKTSLLSIIKSVVGELSNRNDPIDSNIRNLQRKFNRLIEKLGCDDSILKPNGRLFEFDDAEVPLIKAILVNLSKSQGVIADFVNDKDRTFSQEKIHEFIELLLNEFDKSGMDETEVKQMSVFLSNIFLVSPLRSIEYCHRLIDAFAANLQDLTSTQQSIYLIKIENLLKKEIAMRIVESTIHTKEIAEMIELSKYLAEDDIGCQNYCEQEPEVAYEYIKRDKEILRKIQEDDALRQYIETTIGKKAEDIFNYAALES